MRARTQFASVLRFLQQINRPVSQDMYQGFRPCRSHRIAWSLSYPGHLSHGSEMRGAVPSTTDVLSSLRCSPMEKTKSGRLQSFPSTHHDALSGDPLRAAAASFMAGIVQATILLPINTVRFDTPWISALQSQKRPLGCCFGRSRRKSRLMGVARSPQFS